MSKRILVSVALLALLSVGTTIDVRAEMAASDVEEALTCQCGCGLTVHSCNHLECSFAVPTRKNIAESLARGETGEQIIDRYKLKYGEKVLSSPLPRGFNLLAWVAPYAGIFIIGTLMLLRFRRRSRQRTLEPPDETDGLQSSSPSSPELDRWRTQLQEEIEELKR